MTIMMMMINADDMPIAWLLTVLSFIATPLLHRYRDFLFGSQAQIDMKGHKLVKQSLAVGYVQDANLSMLAN